MADKVNPTRMNLIETKRRTQTASRGYGILKKKREALVLEFLKLLKESGKGRTHLYEELMKAYGTVRTASAYVGNFELESAAQHVKEVDEIGIAIKNIMGVRIPQTMKGDNRESVGFNLLSTSIAVDDISDSFMSVMDTIIDVAQREQGLKRLVLEVEKTKRRVNALDYIVIPSLKSQAKYISIRLEELDRDTFSALKHVKKKLSKNESNS
jgi:V/A-type H+/Na+-transporting ATPase subunit D